MAEKLNYQFIIGTELSYQCCDSGNGCFVDPMNKTVKINVPPPAGISNINIPPVQSANRVNPFFKSSGDLVGALDDEHLNTIEAHDPQKLINIGTVDTPIMVSANRTKEFKSSLQLLIKKYPEPFRCEDDSREKGKTKDTNT